MKYVLLTLWAIGPMVGSFPLHRTLSQRPLHKAATMDPSTQSSESVLLDDFVSFLRKKQMEILHQLEDLERPLSGQKFSRDGWGLFADDRADEEERADAVVSSVSTLLSDDQKSGGLTCVLQGGDVIEKGACSLTWIREGILSKERAATVRARQQDAHHDDDDDDDLAVQEGDLYSAAALSMVLHSRSPLVPTFRSDVRVFAVQSTRTGRRQAWLGGGADLTPYYLFEQDIRSFHQHYRDLCQNHFLPDEPDFTYESMKAACDDYFYLPARAEHRGTGGIFFDDMKMHEGTLAFVKGVADTWMPSWLPIVAQRRKTPTTSQQRAWQLLRRGRYLEFNLLYDRGVKFGLANANPRVEGVMVSAPPLIAFEYNHQVDQGSPEDLLLQVLKKPRSWI